MRRKIACTRNAAANPLVHYSSVSEAVSNSSKSQKASTSSNDSADTVKEDAEVHVLATADEPVKKPERKKTQAELDEELKLKLEDMSGYGGAAGLEYENGKAVAMKRGVRDNMFRLI